MSVPYYHNATFYDETTGPQPHTLRAYGPCIQPFQAENATPNLSPEQLIRDNMMVSSYQTMPQSAGSPFHDLWSFREVFGCPLTPTPATQSVALANNDNGRDSGHPSPFTFSPPSRTTTATSVALSLADTTSGGHPTELVDWSDEDFATDIAARMVIYGQALQAQSAGEDNDHPQRQGSQLEPGLGAQLGSWAKEREGSSSTNGINPGGRKRRHIEDDETGDRAVAQRGKTQELPVRGTLARQWNQSKPGHHALGMKPLVVPPQGVWPTLSPGPIVTGATPGPLERAEAWTFCWTEGRGGIIEDPHDERETDKERLERLMKCENGVWRCKECVGKSFRDRSTLQRHCKSSKAHGKQRDIRKCPHCEKEYLRPSGVNRHVKEKHSQVGDGAM